MEKNIREECNRAAFKCLVCLYGKENVLRTFECCSNYGIMLDGSTIDEIRLEGDDIVFVYNSNENDYDYIEHFNIDDLEAFYFGLLHAVRKPLYF